MTGAPDSPVGWGVVAVIALAVAGGTYLSSRNRARAEHERRDVAVGRFDDALQDARAKVREEADALAASRESVRLGHAAVTRSLVKVTSPSR